MTNEDKKPVLRIVYYEDFDLNIFDIVETALIRANLDVKQFGGGSSLLIKKTEMLRGYSDFYINNYDGFDIEFCRQVVSSILPFKFDLEVYEDDPFLNVTIK